MFPSINTEVLSKNDGHPGFLFEFSQHEECLVMINSFQSSFKGA